MFCQKSFQNFIGKKLLAGLLTLTLLFGMFSFFSMSDVYGAEDPAVTVVNPLDGTTVYSSSLLISVKLTAPETIRVNLYKQVKNDSNGNPVALTFDEWSKVRSERTAIVSGTALVAEPAIQVLQGWVMEPVFFTSTGNLAFFTKKVENLSVGVYKVKIDTMGPGETVLYTTEHIVFLKEKTAQPVQANVFENSQTGTVSFLQNLLKSIFGR
jgi:hypothetical protein